MGFSPVIAHDETGHSKTALTLRSRKLPRTRSCMVGKRFGFTRGAIRQIDLARLGLTDGRAREAPRV